MIFISAGEAYICVHSLQVRNCNCNRHMANSESGSLSDGSSSSSSSNDSSAYAGENGGLTLGANSGVLALGANSGVLPRKPASEVQPRLLTLGNNRNKPSDSKKAKEQQLHKVPNDLGSNDSGATLPVPPDRGIPRADPSSSQSESLPLQQRLRKSIKPANALPGMMMLVSKRSLLSAVGGLKGARKGKSKGKKAEKNDKQQTGDVISKAGQDPQTIDHVDSEVPQTLNETESAPAKMLPKKPAKPSAARPPAASRSSSKRRLGASGTRNTQPSARLSEESPHVHRSSTSLGGSAPPGQLGVVEYHSGASLLPAQDYSNVDFDASTESSSEVDNYAGFETCEDRESIDAGASVRLMRFVANTLERGETRYIALKYACIERFGNSVWNQHKVGYPKTWPTRHLVHACHVILVTPLMVCFQKRVQELMAPSVPDR